MKSYLTPALLGLALLLFFMPFVNVYCNGELITQIKGVDLVTGSGSLQKGLVPQRGVRAEPAAILALAGLLLALVFSFLAGSLMKLLAVACNAAGALLLFLLRSRVLGRFQGDPELGNVNIEVSFSLFYWIALLAALAALVSHFFRTARPDESGRDPGPLRQPPPQG